MSTYKDTLAMIRSARDLRDNAGNDLYQEQIRYFNLTREQKKAENNELQRNPALNQKIAGFNSEIADLQARLNSVIDQLRKLQTTADQLNAKQAAFDALSKDLAALQQQLNKLTKADTQPKGADYDSQEKSLLDRIEAEEQALHALEKEIAALSNSAKEGKKEEEQLIRQKKQFEEQIRGLQENITGILNDGQRNYPDTTAQIDTSKKRIQQDTETIKQYSAKVYESIGSLFSEQGPQTVIEQWNDELPIVLLPVRLETKYTAAMAEKQLMVRIYPDDIAVVTHEKVLTQAELDAGHALWKSLWDAKGDADKKKAAWNLIEKQCGANRAAWVALQTKPKNWNANNLASADELKFPDINITKPGSWTVAPHTRMLPDKFVLLGYRQSKDIEFPVRQLVLSKVGNQVNDIVVLGPAPLENGDTPSLKRDEKQENRIQYGDDFKWMADFTTAVQSGLGFVITDKDLTSGSVVDGFDYLVAIGIKVSCDDSDGKKLLEDLLENHNYSKEGLSLIRQGTPTNNTEEKDAGYSKKTTLAERADYIEKGKTLFEPSNDWKGVTDGQRLAEYLGIDYAAIQLVPNSQLREYVEAVAMNKALYGSTMGYFLQSMLNEVMPDAAIRRLRDHFTHYVVGRGPIAALRVGNQPYGIIPTSAFTKWKYPKAGSEREVRAFAENISNNMFASEVYTFLRYCENKWQELVSRTAYIHKQGDAGASLMGVLGLNPTSVEFFQRVGYSLDYLKNLAAFKPAGKYASDVGVADYEKSVVKEILAQLGYTGTKSDGSPKPVPMLLQLVFQHYHTQLDNANLIDGQPLSEDSTIKPYDQTNNFIDWLLANISDATKLESQDFGGAAVPNSLLYMLLRNSLLLETGLSLSTYLGNNGIDAKELIRSRKFMNISSTPSVSPWEIFRAPANTVVSQGASDKPLFEFIHSPYFAGAMGKDITENLDEFKSALGVLRGMKTAQLERAMTEHLDTLSYRLDAWQTSLFDVRLRTHRNVVSGSDARTTGIYIGAYGYLENVKPALKKRMKVSEEVLPASLREGKNNVYSESGNGGYVHAPSLNHAAAAAILRCGYLTHADPANREMLSVNLSSERVRRAKYLIEGIRNGQTLEELLGYQFERGLHDWTTRQDNPVILNHVIPLFRAAFPIKKTKVPQEGNVTGPEEVVDDYHVTNGLALSQVTSAYPYGVQELKSLTPALTSDQISALNAEKDNISNTLDALRDVLTSESAYQLAVGNFDRAAAVMKAISESHMPPDVQVIDSARGTDMAFTNRVCIHFKSDLADNPWQDSPMTERAVSESGLNKWIGDLLGKPVDIVCFVQAVDKDGKVLTKPDGTNLEATISVHDLLIQPIDFLYLVRKKTDQAGKSELEARIRSVFAQKNDLADDVIIKIEFSKPEPAAGSSIKTFAEILPFADSLKTIISGSRPLKARDYDSGSKQVPIAQDNPDNIKVAELQGRVESTFADVKAFVSDLNTANEVATLTKAEADVNNLRGKLKVVSDAGFVDAFPLSSVGFDNKQLEVLSSQADSVLLRFEAITKEYDKKLVVVNDTKTGVEQKTSLLAEMIKSLLGDDFVILPRFSFNDANEITNVYNSRADLLKYSHDTLYIPYVVHEWLHGVSLVRPKMHTFEMLRMLNDTFNQTTLQLEPMQIPFRSKDSWLAVEYPSGTQIVHDTISSICLNPQGFNPSGDQCGLLIDDWMEVIPNEKEVTGISFNYDQPNTVPPQALLLAVTPEETGKWKWDNLVDSVLDTFERAKRRAVEPDLVDQVNGISTLLPALLSEFTTSKNGISLDYSLNIDHVRNEIMNRL